MQRNKFGIHRYSFPERGQVALGKAFPSSLVVIDNDSYYVTGEIAVINRETAGIEFLVVDLSFYEVIADDTEAI